MGDHPLDDPVRSALLGPHAPLAEHHGAAVRYAPDVAPFLARPRTEREWADAAVLAGPDTTAVIGSTHPVEPVAGWVAQRRMPGVRLVAESATGTPADDPVVLGPGDVDAMLALVALTRPGPFERRTIEMGTYLGFRVDGELVAMAGERLHPLGHTEISAVCTHPDHQGRGLASLLVRDLVGRIHARGETPFLHAVADNHRAVALYEHLGFRLRARPDFVVVGSPGVPAEPAEPAGSREQRPAATR